MSDVIATLATLFTADTGDFDRKAGAVTSKLGDLSSSARSVGADMRKTGARITAMTAPLAAVGFLAAKTAMDWESSFAGVRKTVDATDEELAKLEQGLRDLASGRTGSPVAALDDAHTQLALIAESAGQLGVATEDILGFTEAIGMLAMSTNITADNGAMMAAQFANMTDLDLSNMDQFASVIVDLGNNAATTENDILTLGQRIANAGSMAGMSWPSILAFSAAMMSLGFQPEAAGTAFSQFLNDMTVWTTLGMTDKLSVISDVVGISADNFSKLFQEKPDEALLRFFEKLGELPEAEQITVLEELGVQGARAVPVLLGLAGSSGLLADMLKMSTEALGPHNAALEESEKRAATAQGKMNTLKNRVNDLAIEVGMHLIPVLNDLIVQWLIPLAERMGEVPPETMEMIIAFAGLAIALGPVIGLLGTLTTAVGLLLTPVGALAALLLLGAWRAWPEFSGAIDDTMNAIQDRDVVGVLNGMGNALGAIVLGIADWTGAQLGIDVPEGLAAWEGVVENIKTIIQWIGDSAADLLGSIDFDIPKPILDLWGYLKDIVGFAGSVAGLLGIGGGAEITTSYNPAVGIDTRPTLIGGAMKTYGGYRNPGTINGMAAPVAFFEGPSSPPGGHERTIDMRGATVVLQGVQNPDEMLDQLQNAAGRRGMRLAWA